MKHYYVYILSNPSKTVLYIGITNDIKRRVYQHKLLEGFTKKYNCTSLLYYESLQTQQLQLAEKSSKKDWRREWKWNLIKTENSDLKGFSTDWYA